MSPLPGPRSGDRLGTEGSVFATTHWTVVVAAGDKASSKAAEALEKLCRNYWYPLYAFVRRKGHDASEAEDLTQEFFAQLLSKGQLANVDRTKGKFRSWLLGVMKHFLAHEWAKTRAQKRGGGSPILSLDQFGAEERYRVEPVEEQNPERIFQRSWAITVLNQALDRLRGEYTSQGKDRLFEEIKDFVSLEGPDGSYAQVSRRLGRSESAMKSAIHRMRQRYQELIREEIAHTVASPAEVDEEIRHLLAVIRG